MRGRAAPFRASQAVSISLRMQRARAAMLRAADFAGDALHGLEIALRGDGEAGLDDVDAEAFQLVGDGQLLIGVHAAARRLLAIAQGGVKDQDLFGWGSYVGIHPSTFGAFVRH